MERGVNPELGLAILRIVLGVIFIAHGAPSVFGGMESISLLEFLGGISLIVGFLVTPVALLLIVQMMLGIVLVQASRGFYVIGPNANGGIEFSLLLAASLLMLVFGGPGLAAIDARKQD
jgi:putative oxidoreductase